MKFNYKFSSAEAKEEYISISLRIWGCIPVDVKWAINTKIYQNEK